MNFVDEFQNTVLHRAIQAERFDVAKLLIRNGADVNAKNGDDWSTAIHKLSDTGGKNFGIRNRDLSEKDAEGVDLMKLLIKKGVDVMLSLDIKMGLLKIILLFRTQLNGRVDFVKVLIQTG